ncbi:hypothetical protein AALP_AA8G217700 [Arabis alpina]|uniref:non-specific serine/threonine protein kinase n=1 Tax=Arabis alpina TaxID=50452 RepID=A0A087G8L5_ARAAL|nr:hypothetical protein AALP_AA8G217700 [Arabis alpina]
MSKFFSLPVTILIIFTIFAIVLKDEERWEEYGTSCLLWALLGAEERSGFLSISCGLPLGESFREESTNIKYISDEDIIHTGVVNRIKTSLQSQSERHTWYLRSFPQGTRNCYTLNLTRGGNYLIRAVFLHGGYDKNPSTKFDLHLGPNRWATVSTTKESTSETLEVIHQLPTDKLQVCLVKTHDSTPFISALELRKLNKDAYKIISPTKSLQNFFIADIGSVSNQPLRYKGDQYGAYVYGTDVYDRIWMPYNSKNWSPITTSNSVGTNNEYKPPEFAMITASVPTDPYAPLNISLTRLGQTSPIYIVMHFSEIEDIKSSDTREFEIFYNGRLINQPLSPKRLDSHTIYGGEELGPNAMGEYTISLQRTKNSTLPPLLNALEVYFVISLSQNGTSSKEVDAVFKIKSRYELNRIDWEGDPCAPQDYKWDGINCSYKHSEPPKIISLNLTASGLVGGILDSISNLTNLQLLDLSGNNLNGSIPEFLANIDTLTHIYLSSNQLSGSVPAKLLEKVKTGLVLLRIEGNPGLCSTTSCGNGDNERTIIIVIVAIAISIFVAAVFLVIIKRMRRANLEIQSTSDAADSNLEHMEQSSSPDLINNTFTYEYLAQATDDFSSTNIIGKGGFGFVYSGVLPDGRQVAIKQLKSDSLQGEQEFRAEIEIISRVHHKNLVSLIGHCSQGSHRLLVYEFISNNTLEFHLHAKGSPTLNWTQRKQIALDAARGLAYLHDDCNPKTIHRDIKAANILLDESYQAKVADFGLAKCCINSETHLSTRIMGTFGYLAPEYAASGKLTDKADVFSFGVVLLELITGRRPISNSQDETIIDWAKHRITKALNDGDFDGLVDPLLEDGFEISEMRTMVFCASSSIRHSAKLRPRMSQIVRALEGTMSLDDLTQGQSSDYSGENSSGSSTIIEGQQ